MTHYGSTDTDAYKALIWRDQKLSELLATLMDKLKSARDIDGQTLLDNSLIVMGSGLRTAHTRRNVPILLAGGGGGGMKHGGHHLFKENQTHLANLWVSMLKQAGCPVDSFGDSNGVLGAPFG